MALTQVDGFGVRGAHKLIERFGSPQAAYHASLTELESCGLPPRLAQALFAQAGLKEADKEIEEAAKQGCELLTAGGSEYPPLLKQIPDPPLGLYVPGNASILRPSAFH